MRTFLNLVAGLSVTLAASNLSFAAKNYLPDRDTPVPGNQPIPTVDFVRPPLFERPELSPDGKYFAALIKNEELKSNLVVCDISTGKVVLTHGDVSYFSWIGNEHLSLNGAENRVVKVSDPGRLFYVDTVVPKYKFGLMADSGFLRISEVRDEPKFGQIQITRKWFSPVDGELTYCTLIRDDGQKRLYRYEDRKWVECPVNLEDITPIDIGQQANEMLVLGAGGNGETRAIQQLNVVTGELGPILYRDPKHDCLPAIVFKRGTREIAAVRVGKASIRDVWFGETERAVQKLIDQNFKGASASIISMNLGETKFLIGVESDRQPPSFYFLDWEKKSLGLLKNTAPWIDPARMSSTQIISFKNRDGLLIDGLVTLPATATKEKPAPLVTLLHPGPWQYRGEWSWDGGIQFLANHGYAVFVPNYRGSLGYDSRFSIRDRFDFQKMSNDVSDGISALTKTGIVDTKRVAAYGTGFGGYLALAGALENNELYRCAIIYGGVFDWDRAIRKADSSNWFELRWLDRRFQEFNLHPVSPLANSDKIHLPVLFARHISTLDVTIDSQGWFMYSKLKNCVTYGDLNIQTWNEAHSEVVERMDKVLEFLDKHLKTQ